ncbi:MAG: hypothetical protein Q8S00_32575 [Deltaproteobacteria bacterium]|nr:hypothetical protein [Deltaproteobacteria bacterium]
MRVNYHCHFGQPTGYARAAHDNIMALLSVGVSVKIWPFDSYACIDGLESRYMKLTNYLAADDDDPFKDEGVHVYHETPGRLKELLDIDALPGPAVAFTTWETSQLPEEFVDALLSFESVIVPSVFCQHALSKSGVKSEVVPHTLDFDFWEPSDKPKASPFTFYTIGAWNERKNVGALLKAYLAAFRRDDEVKLVIHSIDPDIFETKRILSQSGIPEGQLPRLLITDHFLSEAALLSIHQESHCFVSMTRCEGWGLGAFEALACGNPVLMPGYGGQWDFLPTQSHKVQYTTTPCFPSDRIVIRDDVVTGIRNVPKGVACDQDWAEPSIHDMKVLMRRVFTSRGEDILPIRKKLGSLYNYNKVGERLASVLAYTGK